VTHVVEFEGNTYQFDGEDWYDAKTSLKVASLIGNTLTRRFGRPEARRPREWATSSDPKKRLPASVVLNRALSRRWRTGDYNVYVILLDDAVRRTRDVVPGSDPRKPCVYVGQTVLTPKARFLQHKRGQLNARHVAKHALRLMPELFEMYNPIETREEAEEIEAALAEILHLEGYTVLGGH
jgi:hypothetical protein